METIVYVLVSWDFISQEDGDAPLARSYATKELAIAAAITECDEFIEDFDANEERTITDKDNGCNGSICYRLRAGDRDEWFRAVVTRTKVNGDRS